MSGRPRATPTLPLREGQNRRAVLGRGAERGKTRIPLPEIAGAISALPQGEGWVPRTAAEVKGHD
jgi:hypothetical protein